MIDTAKIRNRSLDVASNWGYPVNRTLPLLETEVGLRPLDSVILRIMAIHLTAAVEAGLDRNKGVEWCRSTGCDGMLTPDEKAFLSSGRGDRQAFADRVEAAYGLCWAIGVVPQLDFSRTCPDDFVMVFPNVKQPYDGRPLFPAASMRPLESILSELDLAYCLNWALRELSIKGRRILGPVKSHVVLERRTALEWIVSDEDWEEITLDT